MKVTPQITADFEDYPELRVLADTAIRRVVELMEIHDIVELRRIQKIGVFDHPYTKDVITPIGLPSVPNTVSAVRYAVGKTLLDYLSTIGITGISLEMTKEDLMAINALWSPPKPKSAPEAPKSLDPQPVGEAERKETNQKPEKGKTKEPVKQDVPEVETPASEHEEEKKNG